MKEEEIREGDIVEIDYIEEFTKEHINEGKALVIWKGNNNHPLVRKLDTKKTIWTCYEYFARVIAHIDIEGYMDKALNKGQKVMDNGMPEQWQELKEIIIEMRDNNGTGTQQEVCRFLANYMDVLEKQMQESTTKNDLGVDCIVDVLSSYTDLDIPYKREIAENILTKLSSVTPKAKTGYWITHRGYNADGFGIEYRCSECNNWNDEKSRDCPNCGAKMENYLKTVEDKKMTFEKVKELFKKSIDSTDTMNQAVENLIQSIYLKGYNDALKHAYCPNCGAKMIETQESEEQ